MQQEALMTAATYEMPGLDLVRWLRLGLSLESRGLILR